MAVTDGNTGNVLRVDLTGEKTSIEPLNKEWARRFVGGKGLAARYLFEELKPGTDPLSPERADDMDRSSRRDDGSLDKQIRCGDEIAIVWHFP